MNKGVQSMGNKILQSEESKTESFPEAYSHLCQGTHNFCAD